MYGTLRIEKVEMYPDDCLQSIYGDDNWWVTDEDADLNQGDLIRCFIPHVDQIPYTFEPIGRNDPRDHEEAIVKVAPLKVEKPLKQTDLPVAAMTLYKNEVWAAFRAKNRPCLVLGTNNKIAKSKFTQGMPKTNYASLILVAPFYGADHTSSFTPAFIERVRHCDYPQFMWDILPMYDGKESILRLDQTQPIGTHHNAFKKTGFKLSEEALGVVNELKTFVLEGGLPKDGDVIAYQELIKESFGT